MTPLLSIIQINWKILLNFRGHLELHMISILSVVASLVSESNCVFFSWTEFLPCNFLLVTMLETEKTKHIFVTSVLKVDMIIVGLDFQFVN